MSEIVAKEAEIKSSFYHSTWHKLSRSLKNSNFQPNPQVTQVWTLIMMRLPWNNLTQHTMQKNWRQCFTAMKNLTLNCPHWPHPWRNQNAQCDTRNHWTQPTLSLTLILPNKSLSKLKQPRRRSLENCCARRNTVSLKYALVLSSDDESSKSSKRSGSQVCTLLKQMML